MVKKKGEIKLLDITASNSIVAVRLKNVISEKGLKQRLNPYGSLKLHRRINLEKDNLVTGCLEKAKNTYSIRTHY